MQGSVPGVLTLVSTEYPAGSCGPAIPSKFVTVPSDLSTHDFDGLSVTYEMILYSVYNLYLEVKTIEKKHQNNLLNTSKHVRSTQVDSQPLGWILG